jgi:nitroreductase
MQPYRFLVITDPATKDTLVPHSWNQRQPADCSHFVVFAARKTNSEADVDQFLERVASARGIGVETLAGFKQILMGDVVNGPRGQQSFEWAALQAYIALGNFMTSAAVIGVDTCPMEGIVPSKYDEVLKLTDTPWSTVVACAAGYRMPGDKYATMPKFRFPASELVIHI